MFHITLQATGKLPGIRFNNNDDALAIAEEAGMIYNPFADQTIASIDKDGALKGGVIYTHWTGQGGSIGMHSASFLPGWVNRTMLWVCFDYPFNQLQVKQIFGQVPTKNKKALRFNTHLGFTHLHRIVDVFPDDDMILMVMRREDCRFLTRG